MAVLLPGVVILRGRGRRRAAQRAMHAQRVVTGADRFDLPCDVERMPEQPLLEMLALDSADRALDPKS